jgi:hypothetical protein
MNRQHAWLLFAAGDAALCLAVGMLFEWPILYALAPLSFPLWAWVESRPEGRAWLGRFFGS